MERREQVKKKRGGQVKKIAWVKWEGICLPKEVGGLGIKDITRFNAALLGTWIWALSSNKNQLWARILTSKHGYGLYPLI